jgi:hypothetical protein
MKLHLRDFVTNVAAATADLDVLDRTAKARIGTNIAAIPAVILSVKAMREFGFKGSFKFGNTMTTMRGNKISTTIYLLGLGYATYQTGMKIREAVKESKQDSYDLGASRTELWAAHLAEGDVTVFDRLVQVREEAMALVKANGLELKPGADSPYFDVKLAREELETMSQTELEELETVLNRRIMAILDTGEEHDDEEAFLHASLVVLEEVLDHRFLYVEPMEKARTETMQRHPSAQHTGLRDRAFNAGASTTVEDLIGKDMMDLAKSDPIAISMMKRVMGDLVSTLPVYLVEVDRYGKGEQIGMHLLQLNVEGDAGPGRICRTLGLFDPNQSQEAVQYFDALQGDFSPALKFSETEQDLQSLIRASVIPLEWKSMTDDELDELVRAHYGHEAV